MFRKKTEQATFYYASINDPYTQRVLIALAYSKAPCDKHLVLHADSLKQVGSETIRMDDLPVLVQGKECETDISEIMDWALDERDPDGWTRWDLDEADSTMALLEWGDDYFYPVLTAYQQTTGDEKQAAYEGGQVYLNALHELLHDSDYLLRDEPTLVDFSIWPFVHQWFSSTDDAARYPQLHRWYNALQKSPALKGMFGT